MKIKCGNLWLKRGDIHLLTIAFINDAFDYNKKSFNIVILNFYISIERNSK